MKQYKTLVWPPSTTSGAGLFLSPLSLARGDWKIHGFATQDTDERQNWKAKNNFEKFTWCKPTKTTNDTANSYQNISSIAKQWSDHHQPRCGDVPEWLNLRMMDSTFCWLRCGN